jgi:isopenicillin-N epimerase
MVDYFYWTGTRDPAAFLSIPAAIAFMEKYNWDAVRQECHILLRQTMARICDWAGMEPPYPLDSDLYAQMGIAPLPPVKDLDRFRKRLYEDYHVVVPVDNWGDRLFTRISVQGYTTQADLDRFFDALVELKMADAV